MTHQFLSIIVSLLIVFFSISDTNASPIIVNGRLSLKDWSPKVDPVLKLDGPWEFQWNRLRSDWNSELKEFYLEVPSNWINIEYYEINKNEFNSAPIAKTKIGASGYATYKLTIDLDPNLALQEVSFRIKDFGSSYNFFVNGNLVGRNGIVSKDPESYKPGMKPAIYTIPLRKEDKFLVLEFEVANYDNVGGGFWNSVVLGKPIDIYQAFQSDSISDSFLLGSLIIIGLYSVIFYLSLRKEKPSLYFGLFCLTISLRIITTGDRLIMDIFPDISFDLVYRLEYLSFYLATPLFAMYLKKLFPIETPRELFRGFMISFCICIAAMFVLPMNIYTRTTIPYQILTVLFFIPALITLIRAIIKKKIEATMILLSSLFLLLTVLNDILFYNNILKFKILVPFGLLQFTFVQAVLLGRRFAGAYKRSEHFARRFRKLNLELENKVRERTKDLNEKIQIIENDMNTARAFQSTTLGGLDTMSEKIIFSVLYEPMIGIGGDLYDIFKISENKYRFFIADVTGHGIQAALVTISIKAAYDTMKLLYDDPGELLNQLNHEFSKKYEKINIYYTCVIADINIKDNKLTIASAGHPDQVLIRKSNVHLIQSKGRIIGLSKDSKYNSRSYEFFPDDRLYIFTDGFFEQVGIDNSMLGEERLYELIAKASDDNLHESTRKIKKSIYDILGSNPIQDDLAMIGIEFRNIKEL